MIILARGVADVVEGLAEAFDLEAEWRVKS
jgi:hypothetical protein